MKVLVLYRPRSEYGRNVETFIRDFRFQHDLNSTRLEVKDVDTRDGGATASLYDVLRYPAILILGDDGSLIKSWEGDDLPLMDELVGYIYST
jgi:hypothetical protein